MKIVAGILILVAGAAFPMVMLAWLNRLFRRKPGPRPAQVGLLLTLNGVLPVGMILLGLSFMSEQIWAVRPLRWAMLAAWLATAGLLIALAVHAATQRGGGAND